MKQSIINQIKISIAPVMVMGLFALFLAPMHVFAMHDTPGEGYRPSDECGYLTGTGVDGLGFVTGGGLVDFGIVDDDYQACFNTNGYFVGSDTGVNQKGSFAWDETIGWIDFAWDTSVFAQDVFIDKSTGYWSGYAWNDAVGWIWFDWTCPGCTQDTYNLFRVHTTPSGIMGGYAWNDVVGWIPFNLAWQELPPLSVTPELRIVALPSGVDSRDVDTWDEAPFADGYQGYAVQVRLKNNDTNKYFLKGDLTALDIAIYTTPETQMRLDQVHQTGSAIIENYFNKGVAGCNVSYPVFVSCPVNNGGEWSFEKFIYSGAPSSNMLGLDADKDGTFDSAISFATDRGGCVGFYEDQTINDCSTGLGDAIKDEVFTSRLSNLNQYIISKIDVTVGGGNASRTYVLSPTPGWSSVDNGPGRSLWRYTPPPEEANLKFKPRYFAKDLFVEYPIDSGNRDMFVQDYSVGDGYTMNLRVNGAISDVSPEYAAFSSDGGYDGSPVQYTSYFQVDEKSDGLGVLKELLIDSETPKAWDVTGNTRADAETNSIYNRKFALGYDVAGESSTEPTVEHWICDDISIARYGDPSCYFTGYLPRANRHLDPESALIVGAINASISSADFANADGTSVVGGKSYVESRNAMFEAVSRLTLGQTPSGGVAHLNANMNPRPLDKGSKIKLLSNDSLLYAKGDVIIDGGANGFKEKTLVVDGGNVYINGNVTGTKLGVVVFANNGVGGNVYIAPNVTDLWANIFIDGALFNYDGDPAHVGADNPIWGSVTDRTETLRNQLYIFGSVSSRNTLGGAKDSGAGTWTLGNGTNSSDYLVALDNDINKGRTFSLCYPFGSLGTVDFNGVASDCNEGEARSAYLDKSGQMVNAPLIIEYSPPSSNLPVFNVI